MMKKRTKGVILMASIALGALTGAFVHVSAEQSVTAKAFSQIQGHTFTQDDYVFEGYSVRYDEQTVFGAENSGNTALRFKYSVSPTMYEYITSTNGVSTGTLIYPTFYLENRDTANLTVTSSGGENGEVVPFNVDTTAAWSYVVSEDVYQAIAYLDQIPSNCYGFEVSTRGYLKVGDSYYYTTATEGRSLAYVANQEYNDQASSFDGGIKSAMREALLKFTLSVDGYSSYKYYGEQIAAPATPSGYHFVGYRIQGRTQIWDTDSTRVYGNATLTAEYVKKENYFLIADGEISCFVPKLPSGITKAYVDDKAYDCTTTYQNVHVWGLTDVERGEVLELRLVSAKGKSYFAAITAVDAMVPYSSYDGGADNLQFDLNDGVAGAGHTIVSVVDATGKTIAHNSTRLTGISENPTATVRKEPVKITDSNGDVYSLLLEVYSRVIYTNREADEFFLGNVSAGTVDTSTAVINDPLTGCYALANDVTLSMPVSHKRTTGGMRGYFDGRGHTVTYSSDAAAGETAALFGYNFTGTICNLGLDFTFTGTYNASLNILSDYATAPNVYLKNVYIHIRTDHELTGQDKLAPVLWGTRRMDYAVHLEDVVIVNSLMQRGAAHAIRPMLIGLDQTWASGNVFKEGGEAYVDEESMVSTSVADMKNVYVIVADGTLATATPLAYASNAGTVYAENAKDNCDQIYEGWYKEIFVHGYSAAKTEVGEKVGSWQLDFGDSLEEMSAEYGK